MSHEPPRLAPAFYAAPGAGRRRWVDWWVLLHPPYTLWHLSYVAIGACIAPSVDGGRLAATLVAFGLAVGVSAHALDELHGRPLRTAIPSGVLGAAAAARPALQGTTLAQNDLAAVPACSNSRLVSATIGCSAARGAA